MWKLKNKKILTKQFETDIILCVRYMRMWRNGRRIRLKI